MCLFVNGFSFQQFFEESHFWKKANVGQLFPRMICAPTIYRSFKYACWTLLLQTLSP